jgi:hypothetical protein
VVVERPLYFSATIGTVTADGGHVATGVASAA